MKKALFITTFLFFLIGNFVMADNRQAPRLVNLQGISYYIYGDPGTEQAKQLMTIATKDLKELKGRNINDLDTIEFTRPPYSHVRSCFGKDEIFIYPDVGVRKEGLVEKIVIEKEKEDIRIEYLPAFEVYDQSGNQIGYVVCESGTWQPLYTPLLTDNVIAYDASRAEVEIARNQGVTVYPFYFPNWKYYYGGGDGNPADRPFDEPVLLDQEVLRIYDGETETIYEDVACTFEELIVEPDWVSYEYTGSGEWTNEPWYPDPSGTHCYGVDNSPSTYFARLRDYYSVNNWATPEQYLQCTVPGYLTDDYDKLLAVEDLPFVASEVSQEITGIGVLENGWRNTADYNPANWETHWTEHENYINNTWWPGLPAWTPEVPQFAGGGFEYKDDTVGLSEYFGQLEGWSNAYDDTKYAMWYMGITYDYEDIYYRDWVLNVNKGPCPYWEFTYPESEEENYGWDFLIIINGERFVFETERGSQYTYSHSSVDKDIDNVHIRYYEITEDFFIVLASIHHDRVDHTQEFWQYAIFRSFVSGGDRMLSDVTIPKQPGSSQYSDNHEIPGVYYNDQPVVSKGHFRLFRKTTETKYAKTSEQIEYRIPEHEVKV